VERRVAADREALRLRRRAPRCFDAEAWGRRASNLSRSPRRRRSRANSMGRGSVTSSLRFNIWVFAMRRRNAATPFLMFCRGRPKTCMGSLEFSGNFVEPEGVQRLAAHGLPAQMAESGARRGGSRLARRPQTGSAPAQSGRPGRDASAPRADARATPRAAPREGFERRQVKSGFRQAQVPVRARLPPPSFPD
jgi:hypothetical protein